MRLIVVSVKGPSHNDEASTVRSIVKACSEVRDRANNGSQVRISTHERIPVGFLDWMRGSVEVVKRDAPV